MNEDTEIQQERKANIISFLLSITFHLLLFLFISFFGGKGISPRATAGTTANIYPVKFYELKGTPEETKKIPVEKMKQVSKPEKVEVSIEKVKQKETIKKETITVKETKKVVKSEVKTAGRTDIKKEELVKGVKLEKSQPIKGKEIEGEGEGEGGYPGDSLFPIVKREPLPPYPKSAQNREEEGTVHLKAYVLNDGTVKEVIIEKSSGSDILDETVKNKIMRDWEFSPKILKGKPVDEWLLISCVFTLENLKVECKY